MTRVRIPPIIVLIGRALLVLLAAVPLALLLTRGGPDHAVGVPPDGRGLGGIGTGLLSPPGSGTPGVGAGSRWPDPAAAGPGAGYSPGTDPGVSAVPAGGTDPAGGGAGGSPGTGGGTRSPSPLPPPSPPSPPPPPPTPTPPAGGPLRATYAVSSGPAGYDVRVTISNPSAVTRSGWVVVVGLPAGEIVTGASGVRFGPATGTVTFTPDGAGSVPGKGSVSFTFTVGGVLAGPPVSCAINDKPCR